MGVYLYNLTYGFAPERTSSFTTILAIGARIPLGMGFSISAGGGAQYFLNHTSQKLNLRWNGLAPAVFFEIGYRF